MGRTIKNGRFCIYNGNEFKVNRDSDGNTIPSFFECTSKSLLNGD